MQENPGNDFQYCEQCDTYFLDVIGESCRCRAPEPEGGEYAEVARQWASGEMIL